MIEAARSRARSPWRERLMELECRVLLTDGEHARAAAMLNGERGRTDGPWISYLRGRLAQDRDSDLALAGKLFQEAAGRARGQDPELLIESLVKLAAVQDQSGKSTEAIALLREAVRESQSGDDFVRGVAEFNLGRVLERDGLRSDEAFRSLDRAAAYSERAGARLLESAARSNLGSAYRKVGEYDRALSELHAALAIQNGAKSPRMAVATISLIGYIHFQRGDLATSLEYLERGVSLARSLNLPLWMRDTSLNLADALRESGRLERAGQVLSETATVFDRYPQLAGREYLALSRGALELARGRAGEAIKLLENVQSADPVVEWEAQAGLAEAFDKLGGSAKARAHYEAALNIIERAQSSQGREEHRLSFLNQVMRFYRGYAALLVREGDEDAALEVEDSSRARSLAVSGESARSGTAAALRRGPPGVFYVAYWIAPDGSYARVLGAGMHRRVAIAAAPEELARLVRGWRTFLERDRGDPSHDPDPAGAELYHALVGPLGIPPGARVVLVPDAPLHGLSFETLPAGGGRLWIDDVTVSVAPALALLEGAPARAKPPSVLAIGDALAAGGEFPRLPAAAVEIDAVRRHFRNAVVKQGPEATPAAFEDAKPEAFSHIHFAAHAKANRESPLDSFVMLSPAGGRARLYARDVARRRLHADLVTLSACRSAGDRAYSGEGLVGLSWAFLRAGANHVIAGLWDVPDEPAARIMALLYDGIERGAAPANALRGAKLAFRAEAKGAERKPYAWAAFQVFDRTRPQR
ncbi:MAG: CHAT domain-containing protein [Bryobacteraceae bacterium]